MVSLINKAFYPFPKLETKRLILREICVSDVPAIFAVFSNPLVTKFYDVPTMVRQEQAVTLTRWWINRIKKRKALRWAITLKSAEDKAIGTCGFSQFDKSNNMAEIGVDIAHPYWGQGIATEAIKVIIDFGFQVMKLNRIETWVMVENIGSLKVLRKNGFLHEGILRERQLWQGEYHDVEMFSILKKDYLSNEVDG